MDRLSFTGAEPGVLDVTGATLHDVDLRAVDRSAITGLAHLRGVAINHLQLPAPGLTEHLGLNVED